jgi:drug/metabolite transporter (DMT)-like permease
MAVLFWGLSFVATKIALQSFSPFCLIFFRFFVAAIFFTALLWRTGFPRFSRVTIKSLIFLAIMQPGLYFTFETLGLQYTSATKTALIIATIPIAVLILSTLLLRERVSLINILGIICSLAGVALLVFGGGGQFRLDGMLIGDLLIFGAVLAASVYTILIRRLSRTLSSLQITGMQIIFGAVLFFPAFLYELPELSLATVSGESLAALAALTLFATIGAFLCYNYALSKIPAAQAAACINGIPLVTAGAAWLLLGETLTPIQLCGGVIVLAAVFMANHAPSPAKLLTAAPKAKEHPVENHMATFDHNP